VDHPENRVSALIDQSLSLLRALRLRSMRFRKTDRMDWMITVYQQLLTPSMITLGATLQWSPDPRKRLPRKQAVL